MLCVREELLFHEAKLFEELQMKYQRHLKDKCQTANQTSVYPMSSLTHYLSTP